MTGWGWGRLEPADRRLERPAERGANGPEPAGNVGRVGGLPSDERPGQGGGGPEGPVHEGPGPVDPDFLVPFDVDGRGIPWWEEAPPPDALRERWWDADGEEHEPLSVRRRPLGVRAIGLATAAALVLATIGAGIGEVFHAGSPRPDIVRAEVTSVSPAPIGAVSSLPTGSHLRGVEVVGVTVFALPGRPVGDCLIEVLRQGRVIGSQTVSVAKWVPIDGGAHGVVEVPIDQPTFAGSPRSARVACSA